MNKIILLIFFMLVNVIALNAQQVIQLYAGKAPGTENWNWQEHEKVVPFRHVYNVVNPTLTAYLPDSTIANGTSVIVCPGGAFQVQYIENEGTMIAEWLKEKGIAAFVLKYRLVHSFTDNAVSEMYQNIKNETKWQEDISPIIEMAISDGKRAIKHVREHAKDFHIDPNRIGIMGFSAGGTVTLGAGLKYDKESRPDFLAPIYPYIKSITVAEVPKDAPPIFICVASDDEFNLAPYSSNLFNIWRASGHSAELHIYAKGGHGFSMITKNLPVDHWIDRFAEWLDFQGLLKNTKKK